MKPIRTVAVSPSRACAIRSVILALGISALSGSAVADDTVDRPARVIKLELFLRKDSDRCDQALKYVRDMIKQREGIELVIHDVIKDQQQLRRLYDLARRGGYKKPAVPMIYCCGRLQLGFDNAAVSGPKINDLFTMHVYTRATCHRCKNAKVFLKAMHRRWPGLRIVIYEITNDVVARNDWNALLQRFRVTAGLPTIHFADRLIVGYQGDAITGKQIESLVGQVCDGKSPPTIRQPPLPSSATPPLGFSLPAFHLLGLMLQQSAVPAADAVDEAPLPGFDDVPPLPESDDVPPLPESDDVPPLPDVTGAEATVDPASQTDEANDIIEVPVFGELRVSSLGLPAFTFLVGLIDGFNPCAMWVLVFLLTVLVNIKDRRKMILIAGTFVVISGVAYFAFMAAWLNVFMLIGIARPVQIALGCMAIFIGLVNVKDFYAFKKGISFSIPESQKPGIYARVRKIVEAKYLTAALSAAVVLAIVVNLVELLCTAGLPALYSQVLLMQELPAWTNYCYLGLYNIAYMLDDTVLLTIVVVTLSRRRLQEREGRWLKLISGIAILTLGAIMIFKPSWLQLTG